MWEFRHRPTALLEVDAARWGVRESGMTPRNATCGLTGVVLRNGLVRIPRCNSLAATNGQILWPLRKASMARTLTLDGTIHEVREVWVCMCSSNGSGDSIGDHRWDPPTPKCYRKGGHYRDDLFDLKTGEWVGFAPTPKEVK